MKAILCLAIAICSVSNVLAQPMVVEWEREMTYKSTSFDGIDCWGMLADDSSGVFYLTGAVLRRWSEVDTSAALVIKFTPDGDSLWSKFYDLENLQNFGSAVLKPEGSFVSGANLPGLYFLDQKGNLVNSVTGSCLGLQSGVETITTTADGRILTGSRCLISEEPYVEEAIITCYREDGDSLWSVTRNYAEVSRVHKIVAMAAGRAFATVSYGNHGLGTYGLLLDSLGNVLQEVPLPSYIKDLIVLPPDTLLIACREYGWNALQIKMMNLDGNLLAERFFTSVSPEKAKLFRTSRGDFRVINRNGIVLELSPNLDSLWSQDLPEYFPEFFNLLPDGGMIYARNVLHAPHDHYIFVSRMSRPFPYLQVSRSYLNFGNTQIGDVIIRTLTLRNSGPDSLLVESMDVPDGFSVTPGGPFWIRFDQPVEISVKFAPTEQIDYEGELVIETGSPFSPPSIELTGHVVTTSVNESNMTPITFALSPAYPNPFNPTTTFSFSVAHDANVELGVFDIQGRLVSKVVRGNFIAGQHSVNWACAECASGIYFITMNAGSFTASQKLLLLK